MGDSKAVQSSGMRWDFTTLSNALCISLEALCCRLIFLKQAAKWESQGTGRESGICGYLSRINPPGSGSLSRRVRPVRGFISCAQQGGICSYGILSLYHCCGLDGHWDWAAFASGIFHSGQHLLCPAPKIYTPFKPMSQGSGRPKTAELRKLKATKISNQPLIFRLLLPTCSFMRP